ncbi:hypothetical protein [Micromonospora sp. Llam0]|uniref:hypothetical protein n=1 Tax=Micromonospora sp. Llam0 TaxID=2485143 RepID=UPI0011CDC2E6|nr:hypothetical protein [Micromonospora sp. Llam0]
MRTTGAPTANPLDRDRVPAADSYQPGDPVWVHRHGEWNSGMVREASGRAVLVDYHRPGQRGSLTDTVLNLYVMRRDDPDPLLDTHPPHAIPYTQADQDAAGGAPSMTGS